MADKVSEEGVAFDAAEFLAREKQVKENIQRHK